MYDDCKLEARNNTRVYLYDNSSTVVVDQGVYGFAEGNAKIMIPLYYNGNKKPNITINSNTVKFTDANDSPIFKMSSDELDIKMRYVGIK